MAISIYEACVLASLLAGIIMVLASLYLLYKGVLKLSGAAGEETSIEFTKNLRFTTHYPALALFVFGGIFLGYPLYLSSKDAQNPVNVQLKVTITPASDLEDVRVHVNALGASGEETPDSDGKISWKFLPGLNKVKVEVVAPGRKSVTKIIDMSGKGAQVDVGEVVMPSSLVDLKGLMGGTP